MPKTFSLRGVALAAGLLASTMAQAHGEQPGQNGMPEALSRPLDITFCIYDPIGENGDAASRARDMALEARRWNIVTRIRIYTDERVAAEDFKAGQCEGLVVSTLRARQFNKFMGSIDAVGAIPGYREMHAVLDVLANPKTIPLSISGPYQVIGIIPLGAAYVFVNDRSINSVEKAAGKKVAVMDWDKSQARLVQQLGSQPVASDVTNFSSKFNNGQVDIIVAPAIVFKPFELYRGLGSKGGIFHFPVAQVTASIVINREKLLKQVPDMDARMEKLRNSALTRVQEAFDYIDKAEKEIEQKYWMDLTPTERDRYVRMMRDSRLQLTKEGIYDPRMMALLKRVRCKFDPQNYECTLGDE